MDSLASVGVLSRSFSANDTLVAELRRRYADVTLNATGRTLAGDELVAFLQGRTHAIVALEKITADVLDRLPDLKVIGKYGVGLDNIDLGSCAEREVKVGWTGGVNRRAVAELVVGLAIACLRSIVASSHEIRTGTFRQIKGRHLQGRKVGLLGCGHVGQEVARLLIGLGCEVQAHDIRDLTPFYREAGVRPVSLDELVRSSEILSLHVPLTPATAMIIDAQRLSEMRTDAILINTARGGLVDEGALKTALATGKLAAAAFDVFDPEPPLDMELLCLPNFVATGHIGGSAEEAILAMGMAAIDALDNPRHALAHVPEYL